MRKVEVDQILKELQKGKAAYLRRDINGRLFLRKFSPTERLIILGGGHIAQPLSKIASLLDDQVIVVDDRLSFANYERFPDAVQVICDDFAKAISDLKLLPSDYVCIITRGHKHDGVCLREILSGDFPFYLGMIGSPHRVGGLFSALKEEGYNQELLARIHTPIGLKINAITPSEIALSICAELVSRRRCLLPDDDNTLPQSNTDVSLLKFLMAESGPRAWMLVLETEGSTPVKAGAIMAIDLYGNTYGTIGGGCSESELIAKARRLIRHGGSEIAEVDMTNDIASEEGMVCGGTMRVLIETIESSY